MMNLAEYVRYMKLIELEQKKPSILLNDKDYQAEIERYNQEYEKKRAEIFAISKKADNFFHWFIVGLIFFAFIFVYVLYFLLGG